MSALSERDALALWEELRSAMTNLDRLVRRVVETKAWEPLGYSTFSEAWSARMQGTRLGTSSMAAHVVYALIDEGMDRDTALLTLGPSSGIGPRKFDALARQRDNGVPPHLATTVVREHFREKPTAPHVIHVELSHDEWLDFRALADANGCDMADEAAKAVRSHFRAMERTVRHAV